MNKLTEKPAEPLLVVYACLMLLVLPTLVALAPLVEIITNWLERRKLHKI